MDLPNTRAAGIHVTWLDETPSTNDTLEQLWKADQHLADGTLVVTGHQTAGRGRQQRGWETPAGKALAASILVRGFQGLEMSWLPLIVGSAVVRALEPLFPGRRVAVKWPNDVHVMSREDETKLGAKLNGILCQVLPDGSVIVGVGSNLFLTPNDLPTERAGSWLTEGADVDGATALTSEAGARIADGYLARFCTELQTLVTLTGTDPEEVIRQIREDSATLGTHVRAHLPSGSTPAGVAEALADDGALHIRLDSGELLTVHAGDVEHLRER